MIERIGTKLIYILGRSTFDAMTVAVENSAVVVPVLTSAYQESVNCRKGMLFINIKVHKIILFHFKAFKEFRAFCFEHSHKICHFCGKLVLSYLKHCFYKNSYLTWS